MDERDRGVESCDRFNGCFARGSCHAQGVEYFDLDSLASCFAYARDAQLFGCIVCASSCRCEIYTSRLQFAPRVANVVLRTRPGFLERNSCLSECRSCLIGDRQSRSAVDDRKGRDERDLPSGTPELR